MGLHQFGTWGYVHGERGKGSVEEAQNEEERNDRGEGVPNEGCDDVRQDRGTERAEENFGGARRENGGDHVKKKKRYARIRNCHPEHGWWCYTSFKIERVAGRAQPLVPSSS